MSLFNLFIYLIIIVIIIIIIIIFKSMAWRLLPQIPVFRFRVHNSLSEFRFFVLGFTLRETGFNRHVEARVFYARETVERNCGAYVLCIEADMNLGCSVA